MSNNKNAPGIIFIAIGVIFLLLKFDLFKLPFSFFNIFGSLLDLWPVALIVVGLSVIFYKRTIFKLILWVCFIIILVLYASFGSHVDGIRFFIQNGRIESDFGDKKISKEYVMEINDDAEYGSLEVDLGGCTFELNEDDESFMESNMNISYQSNYNEAANKMEIKVWEEDISKNFAGKDRSIELKLDEDLVWDINANIGAVDADFDMTELKIRTLDLQLGAGNADIFLGDDNEETNVHLNGGASNITLHIPEDSDIKVVKNGKLVNIEDEIGLNQNGSEYLSKSSDEAETIFNIYVNANAANVKIKYD